MRRSARVKTWALSCRAQGKSDEADKEASLKRNGSRPGDPDDLLSLGFALASTGKLDEAISKYREGNPAQTPATAKPTSYLGSGRYWSRQSMTKPSRRVPRGNPARSR